MLIVGIVCTTLLKSLDRLIDLVDGVEVNGKVLLDSVNVLEAGRCPQY
jgi:ABC-type phosphate transport system ATPase subunit